jgi:acyl-CoA dehydrogenase
MIDLSHLAWPFFGEAHRQFAPALAQWANQNVVAHIDHADVDRTCRVLVRELGDAGWLKAVVPAAFGGLSDKIDVRTLCLAREVLAWHDSLADFAFAMQGLGTGSISLFGSDELKAKYLPPVRDGRHIAAFALSEPEAGSDVGALATTAKADGPGHVRLDGVKTWITTSCSHGPEKHPALRACPPSSSTPTRPDFRLSVGSRSSRRIRLPRCVSTAAACRWQIGWARQATVSR